MYELSEGTGIYIYESQKDQAVSKGTGKLIAQFLMNIFYKRHQMVGMNLTGANDKSAMDPDIRDAIIGNIIINYSL